MRSNETSSSVRSNRWFLVAVIGVDQSKVVGRCRLGRNRARAVGNVTMVHGRQYCCILYSAVVLGGCRGRLQ